MDYPKNDHETAGPTKLDRLWDATRPADPPAESWTRVWGGVTAALAPASTAPTLEFRPPRSRTPYWLAVAAVAQAAAVLVGATVLLRVMDRDRTPASAPVVAASSGTEWEFNIDEGQTLILVVGERSNHVVCNPKLVQTSDLVAMDFEDPNADPYGEAVALSMDVETVALSMDVLSAAETIE